MYGLRPKTQANKRSSNVGPQSPMREHAAGNYMGYEGHVKKRMKLGSSQFHTRNKSCGGFNYDSSYLDSQTHENSGGVQQLSTQRQKMFMMNAFPMSQSLIQMNHRENVQKSFARKGNSLLTSSNNFRGPYGKQGNKFNEARFSNPLPKGGHGKRINTMQDKQIGASSKISIFDSNSVTAHEPEFIIGGSKNIDIKANRYPVPNTAMSNNYFARPMTSGNNSIDFNNSKRDNPMDRSDLQNMIDINVNKATEEDYPVIEFQNVTHEDHHEDRNSVQQISEGIEPEIFSNKQSKKELLKEQQEKKMIKWFKEANEMILKMRERDCKQNTLDHMEEYKELLKAQGKIKTTTNSSLTNIENERQKLMDKLIKEDPMAVSNETIMRHRLLNTFVHSYKNMLSLNNVPATTQTNKDKENSNKPNDDFCLAVDFTQFHSEMMRQMVQEASYKEMNAQAAQQKMAQRRRREAGIHKKVDTGLDQNLYERIELALMNNLPIKNNGQSYKEDQAELAEIMKQAKQSEKQMAKDVLTKQVDAYKFACRKKSKISDMQVQKITILKKLMYENQNSEADVIRRQACRDQMEKAYTEKQRCLTQYPRISQNPVQKKNIESNLSKNQQKVCVQFEDIFNKIQSVERPQKRAQTNKAKTGGHIDLRNYQRRFKQINKQLTGYHNQINEYIDDVDKEKARMQKQKQMVDLKKPLDMFLGVFTTKKGKKALQKQEKEASKAGAVSSILLKKQKASGTFLINQYKKNYASNTNETVKSEDESHTVDENGKGEPITSGRPLNNINEDTADDHEEQQQDALSIEV